MGILSWWLEIVFAIVGESLSNLGDDSNVSLKLTFRNSKNNTPPFSLIFFLAWEILQLFTLINGSGRTETIESFPWAFPVWKLKQRPKPSEIQEYLHHPEYTYEIYTLIIYIQEYAHQPRL